MDIATVAISLVSSFGISTATAAWLSQTLIRHRLQKDLENHRGNLVTELETHKDMLNRERDEWQASLRGRVDSTLGDKAADREYRLEARKRLYQAIGPLRFQLLLACRDLSARIHRHGTNANANAYPMSISGYYGRSTLYRLLRPLAVSDLIERQIAYADFAVDPAAIEVLRFRRAAFLAWTHGDILLDHPGTNWDDEEQHVFSDNLRSASCTLIKREDTSSERILHYQEFGEFLAGADNLGLLEPFPHLLEGFSIDTKPILWLRLVCYGFVCSRFVGLQGHDLGFEDRPFPLRGLLKICRDEYIQSKLDAYETALSNVMKVSL